MDTRAWRTTWLLVIVAVCLTAATAALGQEADEGRTLVAELGKVKDLNEKDPQLVRAKFTDPATDVVVEEEKLYVRWERTHKEQGRWIILSAFCPHSKCKVIYNADARVFEDPCYGSVYDLDGRVKKGPSKQPLPDYSEMAYEEDGLLMLRRQPEE